MPKSLAEFSSEKSTKTACPVCNASDEVRRQIEENETAPSHAHLSRPLVVTWAKQEFGYDISVDSIYRHNRSHVFL